MSSTDYQIPAFTHKIADLPDQPNLSPSELKQRFDACPEELRVAHNALAKCVSGITDATYPDTVTESMLAEAVREKLDGKADKTDLYFGLYEGDGTYPREIALGFTPRLVYVTRSSGQAISSGYVCSCLALPETNTTEAATFCKITNGGFTLYQNEHDFSYLNRQGDKMCYIAIK